MRNRVPFTYFSEEIGGMSNIPYRQETIYLKVPSRGKLHIFPYERRNVHKEKNTIDSQTGIPQRVQGAFKDSMIHGKQFTLRIAFRCVLHRCESQEIRCQKLFLLLDKIRLNS